MTVSETGGYPLTPEACGTPEYRAMCDARTKLTGFASEHGALLADGSASGAVAHEELALSIDLFLAMARWIAVACPSLADLTDEEHGTAGVMAQLGKMRGQGRT